MTVASLTSGLYIGYVLYGTRNRVGGRTLMPETRHVRTTTILCIVIVIISRLKQVPPSWTHVLLCESSRPALPEHLSCRRNLRTRRLVCRVDCAVYGAVAVTVLDNIGRREIIIICADVDIMRMEPPVLFW